MSILKTSIVATGAAALLLSLGAVSSAQAGGGKKMHFGGHHHHHHFHGGYGPSFYVDGGGCGYYKRMFWKTGNYYWKAKYYDCLY